MNFEEILPALKEGKKIRRKSWHKIHGVQKINATDDSIVDENGEYFPFVLEDFLSNDWEVIKEKRRVKLRDLTPEQYKNWYRDYCCGHCEGCVFDKTNCDPHDERFCWVNNKDLYSDKFLDREVEIEE